MCDPVAYYVDYTLGSFSNTVTVHLSLHDGYAALGEKTLEVEKVRCEETPIHNPAKAPDY